MTGSLLLLWQIMAWIEGLQCLEFVIMALGHYLRVVRIDWGEFCALSFNLCEEMSAIQTGF
jgi:hypothetical protein